MGKKRKNINLNNNLWVISLGGSRIAPKEEEIDWRFIQRFKKLIDKNSEKRFVVVTGGGATARKYIQALKKLGKNMKKQSSAGIAITRFHASVLARIFGKKANPPSYDELPRNMTKVKNLLRKNKIVFCGALRFHPKQTSDGTAADLAAYLKCGFINLTNVSGLYTSNPKKNKNARLIKNISWSRFYNIANKIRFKAGQHFVLDKDAAETIMNEKIPTYITGSLKEMNNIISGNKNFKGTLIYG